MSALDKVLALSGTQAPAEVPDADLVLALSSALDGLRLYFANSDSDDDGDDDSGGKGDSDDDSGHSDHGTYKALIKKGVNPKLAAKMCAKSDKKVAASALAESACVILSSLISEDAPAPEPTYLGRVVALASGGAVASLHHGPFTGAHKHAHPVVQAHEHQHFHNGDSEHHGHAHMDGASGAVSGGHGEY